MRVKYRKGANCSHSNIQIFKYSNMKIPITQPRKAERKMRGNDDKRT